MSSSDPFSEKHTGSRPAEPQQRTAPADGVSNGLSGERKLRIIQEVVDENDEFGLTVVSASFLNL